MLNNIFFNSTAWRGLNVIINIFFKRSLVADTTKVRYVMLSLSLSLSLSLYVLVRCVCYNMRI